MRWSFYNSTLHSRVALGLLLLYFIVTIYFATAVGTSFFIDNLWDKFKHISSFFVLYVLLDIAFYKYHPSLLFGGAFLYGVAIEVVQMFLPHRDPSILDLLANLVGIILALLLLIGLKKWGRYQREIP